MSGPPWSEHQVETLRRMRADGSLNREIASALGKSEVAIKAKIKALQLPKPEDAVRPKHRPGPNHQKWQWQRRDGSPPNKAGRNSARSIMKPADGADAAACMAEMRDAVEALTPQCCRWPIGEVGKPGFRFCCAQKESLSGPYCAEHMREAWAPLKPKVWRDTAYASDLA